MAFPILVLIFLMTPALRAEVRFETVLARLLAGPPPELRPPQTHAPADDLISVYMKEMEAVGKVTKDLERSKRYAFLSQHVWRKNQEVIRLLDAGSAPVGQRALGEAAAKAFSALSTNEVTKVSSNKRYDHGGSVGFCFARAVLAHDLLLGLGKDQADLAKIFAVGKLMYGDRLWEFHMATMVKGPGAWLVLDNLFDRVLTHREWMKKVSALDLKGEGLSQVRFYITDPRKFQPAYGPYEMAHLEIPELKPYFSDLFGPGPKAK